MESSGDGEEKKDDDKKHNNDNKKKDKDKKKHKQYAFYTHDGKMQKVEFSEEDLNPYHSHDNNAKGKILLHYVVLTRLYVYRVSGVTPTKTFN